MEENPKSKKEKKKEKEKEKPRKAESVPATSGLLTEAGSLTAALQKLKSTKESEKDRTEKFNSFNERTLHSSKKNSYGLPNFGTVKAQKSPPLKSPGESNSLIDMFNPPAQRRNSIGSIEPANQRILPPPLPKNFQTSLVAPLNKRGSRSARESPDSRTRRIEIGSKSDFQTSPAPGSPNEEEQSPVESNNSSRPISPTVAPALPMRPALSRAVSLGPPSVPPTPPARPAKPESLILALQSQRSSINGPASTSGSPVSGEESKEIEQQRESSPQQANSSIINL